MRLNNRLQVFISHFQIPVAWAVDATSLSWDGMISYAFPPIPLLMKVLLKMEKESCLVILMEESFILPGPAVSDGCTSSQASNSEGSFDPSSFPVFLIRSRKSTTCTQGGLEKAGFSKTKIYRESLCLKTSLHKTFL